MCNLIGGLIRNAEIGTKLTRTGHKIPNGLACVPTGLISPCICHASFPFLQRHLCFYFLRYTICELKDFTSYLKITLNRWGNRDTNTWQNITHPQETHISPRYSLRMLPKRKKKQRTRLDFTSLSLVIVMSNMEFRFEVSVCNSSNSRHKQIGTRLELTKMFVVDEFLFVLDRAFISFFRKPLNEHFLQLQQVQIHKRVWAKPWKPSSGYDFIWTYSEAHGLSKTINHPQLN